MPGVVVSTPEITKLCISDMHDFIFIGCDGIFDRLGNEDVCNAYWDIRRHNRIASLTSVCKTAVDSILREAMVRQSYDNVTGVIICFNDLSGDDVDNRVYHNLVSRNNRITNNLPASFKNIISSIQAIQERKLCTNRSLTHLKENQVLRPISSKHKYNSVAESGKYKMKNIRARNIVSHRSLFDSVQK
jgi:hypothetical protein